MSRTITETEARENIAQLIAEAASGEEFIISRENSPDVRLAPITQPNAVENKVSDAVQQKREKAIESIRALRKKVVIGPPMTIEEIISARDEGRKYL